MQKLTVAQGLVKYLCHQYIIIDGKKKQLFPGIFGIFGHGNVTCLASALYQVKEVLPTWRGQNEQSMAHAAIAYSKAVLRQQIMVATSSVGPGALNMVTAAGVAHTNHLPLLILSGDYFANRRPDPVLQQVEHPHDPTLSVNDAFKPVTRYWDRITHPEQILQSLPHAVATLVDPGSCGPAFIGLCQDIQGVAYDYPEEFFADCVWHIPRPESDKQELKNALALLKSAQKPLIIAGGGVRYSRANATLSQFAQKYQIPVVETVAGRATLVHSDPSFAGPIGVTGSDSANYMSKNADVIVALGTKLQDFTTGSWTNFSPSAQFIAVNTRRFDTTKHRALAVVADVKVTLEQFDARFADFAGFDAGWYATARSQLQQWDGAIDTYNAQTGTLMHYGHIIAAVNKQCQDNSYVLTAAGGFPGELNKMWRTSTPDTVDCEYGFSCMGYEIAGGWGAKMACPHNDVYVLVGDGSYMMMNSDIYSSVLTGHKLIVIVCDNFGFAVINRLQNATGGASFNNQIADCKITEPFSVNFAQHAASMGAYSKKVETQEQFIAALKWAKTTDKTTVICVEIDPFTWSKGGCWWDVGMPEVSDSTAIQQASVEHQHGRLQQRRGI